MNKVSFYLKWINSISTADREDFNKDFTDLFTWQDMNKCPEETWLIFKCKELTRPFLIGRKFGSKIHTSYGEFPLDYFIGFKELELHEL